MSKKWYSTPGFRENGNSWFDAGFRKMVREVLHGLSGGKYGERLEEKMKQTPEGKQILESYKKAPWYKLW